MPNIRKIFKEIDKKEPQSHSKNYRAWNFDETIRKHPSVFLEDLDNSLGNKKQNLDNSLDNSLDNNLDNKQTKKEIRAILLKLKGNNEKIINYIVNICIENNNNITGPIFTNEIANELNVSKGVLKTTIYRLTKLTLLKRLPGKVSNHGYINLKIKDYVKNIWKEKIEITELIINKTKSNLDNKQINNSLYNSNSNIITTINKKEEKNDSKNPWMSINIFPLEQYGLKQSHLKQLQKMNCTTPEIVQESIHHMAYGLENTKDTKKYDYPIKVLMGVLKKGDAWIEEKYIDPNERALKKIIDARKRKLLAKQKLISELKDIEFNNWFEELTESKLLNIIEETDGVGGIIAEMYKKDKKISDMTKGTILKYFNETVWIQIKKDMNI